MNITLQLFGRFRDFADAPELHLEFPGVTTTAEFRAAFEAWARAHWPDAAASAFAYARGMLYWQARSRFCGVCGAAVAFDRAGFVGHCGQCGTDHYPRVDPAVIVAVSDGQRLLLGRQPGWAPRRWSVLAGFVEPGEAPERTVVREVHEEARVRVRACQYLGAQPWPFPGALMLGFQALAEADEPCVDGELEQARWFSREEIAQAMARDGCQPEFWRRKRR